MFKQSIKKVRTHVQDTTNPNVIGDYIGNIGIVGGQRGTFGSDILNPLSVREREVIKIWESEEIVPDYKFKVIIFKDYTMDFKIYKKQWIELNSKTINHDKEKNNIKKIAIGKAWAKDMINRFLKEDKKRIEDLDVLTKALDVEALEMIGHLEKIK